MGCPVRVHPVPGLNRQRSSRSLTLRSPGSSPRSRGSSLRSRGSSPRSPGSSLRSLGSSPRSPGSSLRSLGSSPRSQGSSPRSLGSSPRSPGSSPRSPGSSPRSPGSSLRSPGSSAGSGPGSARSAQSSTRLSERSQTGHPRNRLDAQRGAPTSQEKAASERMSVSEAARTDRGGYLSGLSLGGRDPQPPERYSSARTRCPHLPPLACAHHVRYGDVSRFRTELDESHNLLHHSLADVLPWPIERAPRPPGEGSGQRCCVANGSSRRCRACSRAYWARVRAAELRSLFLVSALAPG